MDSVVFDPLKLKVPCGTICKNSYVEFSVNVNNFRCVKSVIFMIKEDLSKNYEYIEMQWIENQFKIKYFFNSEGHYFYNFKVIFSDNCEMFLNKTFDYYSKLDLDKKDDFVQIVTSEDYFNVNSLQGGFVYQIMIDRFCRGKDVKQREPLFLRDDWCGDIKKFSSNAEFLNRQVFGGNIKGVISKLGYLKDLGVTAIYFTPISQGNSHHKYDTADYFKIDEMFGSEDDFKYLLKCASDVNIKIIIDGVYNHTGADSIYFNRENTFDNIGAFNSKKSTYYNWYSFYDYPTDYESWWGIKTLPSIKKDCKEYQNFIAGSGGVIEKFMNMGVFGIRLDVVDELSSEFVKQISNKIASYGKDCVCLGEVWEDASTKISYSKRRSYFTNNELNSVMNYPLKNAIIDYIRSGNSSNINAVIRMILTCYPKNVGDNLINMLGTHDTSRFFSELKTICGLEDVDVKGVIINNPNILNNEFHSDISDKIKRFVALFKIAFVLIFTVIGVPVVFYGDEYGMENSDDNPRACFDWNSYDNFFYKFVKSLAKMRRLEVFKNGEMKVLLSEEGKFVFERFSESEQLIVAINLKPSVLKIDFSGNFKSLIKKEKINKIILYENEFDILITNKL